MRRSVARRVIGSAAMAGLATGAMLGSPGLAAAAFPGQNGDIAYTHLVGMSSAAIYRASPNGGAPTNLSAVGAGTAMTADFQPAWSADGKQIAFVRVNLPSCSGQIWTMRADGTSLTNVSNDAASANEFNPAYGPDGSIVFVRAAAGTFNICTNSPVTRGTLWIRRPGGTLRQLTTGATDNTPAISPDGSRIAFTRVAPGGPHIFVMNADGSGTPVDLGAGVKPNWSPDGKKITFAGPSAPNGPTGGPVMVMNADGSNRQTLNTNGTAPVFSPDGTGIAYLAFAQATNSSLIGVMSANGQNQHTVTTPGSGNSDVKPDWQPILRRLRLKVSPRNAIARRRACFRFRVSSSGKAVGNVQIVFAHHHASSSAKGRAQVCMALRRGRYTATATKPGYQVAAAQVRVRSTARHVLPVGTPRFTG